MSRMWTRPTNAPLNAARRRWRNRKTSLTMRGAPECRIHLETRGGYLHSKNAFNQQTNQSQKEVLNNEIVREETRVGESENRYGRAAHRDQEGRVHTQFRQQASQVGRQRPDLSWQHRSSHGSRPAGGASDVDGGEDGPSGSDRLSLDGFREDMEGGVEAPRFREGPRRREGARG